MRDLINIVEQLSDSDLSSVPDFLQHLVRDDGNIEVWRAIVAGPGFVEDLLPNSGIGKCWSYEEDGAIPYEGGRGIIYRLHGLMPLSSIDWNKTIELHGSGESEIRALVNKPVILLCVDRINLAGKTLESDLKPSIHRQMFTTGPWV